MDEHVAALDNSVYPCKSRLSNVHSFRRKTHNQDRPNHLATAIHGSVSPPVFRIDDPAIGTTVRACQTQTLAKALITSWSFCRSGRSRLPSAGRDLLWRNAFAPGPTRQARQEGPTCADCAGITDDPIGICSACRGRASRRFRPCVSFCRLRKVDVTI